ncbi:hypothetical protein ACFLQL_00030 [Verrucomicrobiota bacterium]
MNKLFLILCTLLITTVSEAQFQRVPADQVSVVDTNFNYLVGTNAQAVFESIDSMISTSGGGGTVSGVTATPLFGASNNAYVTDGTNIYVMFNTNLVSGGTNGIGVQGSFTIDPSGISTVNFGYTFPSPPYVSFTMRDTNAELLATANILTKTNNFCTVEFISSGDPITNAWNVDYAAFIGGDQITTNTPYNWSLYPAISDVDISNKNINNIASMTSTGIANFKTIALNYSGQQELNSGDTISPYSNIKINSTNSGVITLGDPQILTNGIADGSIIFIKGADATEGILLTNGQGILTDCELSFLIKPNDVIQFMYLDDKWVEIERIDK